MSRKNIHQILIANAERARSYDFSFLNNLDKPVRKLTGSKMLIKKNNPSRTEITFNI